jgi:hypothetical protein
MDRGFALITLPSILSWTLVPVCLLAFVNSAFIIIFIIKFQMAKKGLLLLLMVSAMWSV